MAAKSRSAAAKKAWATRRKLYGASGTGKKSGPSKRTVKNMKNGISKQRAAGIGVVRTSNARKTERKKLTRAVNKNKAYGSHRSNKDYQSWMDDPRSVAAAHKAYLRKNKRK